MIRTILLTLAAATVLSAQPAYDLLLKGGYVIDPKNRISKLSDVAIAGGKIAKVAPNIPDTEAKRVADVRGLYVTPGLIDIHVHVYTGTGLRALTGDDSVQPDAFSFRSGVTTMVDAGTAGWRNFPDFRQRVIERAKTRVLAFLNIVGGGMAPTPNTENDPADMDVDATARMARENKDVIVGIKTAHYHGPGWFAVDRSVQAGEATGLPVMVDFGYTTKERNLTALLEQKLRAGDIYTHCYSGHRDELLNGKINPAMWVGRKRGIIFDLGHGGGSFYWNVAVPAFQEKFYPDVISTDLHSGSMNSGMKNMINVMSKVLNLGASIEDVVLWSTWKPAQVINRPELGHLDVGAPADVTVLRVEKGKFGFLDAAGARMDGNKLLTTEMTIRDGKVMWDLNGHAAVDWKVFKYKKREQPK